MIYTGIMIHIMDFQPRRHTMSAATKMRHTAPKARKMHEITVKAVGGVYVDSMVNVNVHRESEGLTNILTGACYLLIYDDLRARIVR